MDRFLVRKRAADATGGSALNGTKVFEEPAKKLCLTTLDDPQTVISWNVNGLVVQLRNNWSLIKTFLESEQPDVLCLQEVRLPAAGPKGCKRADGQKRRRGEAKCDSAQEKADWDVVQKTLISTFAGGYTFHWSLADWKYSGTLMMIRRGLAFSRMEFTRPSILQHQGHRDVADDTCHPEEKRVASVRLCQGRVIFVSFKTFDLLATYSPNNGNDAAAFERRRAWDAAMKQEVATRTRPLIWIGDLNVAADRVDVTHPEWFLQQCYQGEPEDMRGQPGFTKGERVRFQEILSEGKLVDSFRHLHPVEDVPPALGPFFTWRGHPPVHQAVARYHGKGMRIDYALVAQELLPRLSACDILGSGADRNGFLGSDHCPLRLSMAKLEAEKEVKAPKPLVFDLD